MTSGVSGNQYIPLPLRLRIRFAWNCIMRSVPLQKDEETDPSYVLEREFKEVITRENATISKICFSYSSSVADFDDLRQDALINIWRGMRSFRGEASRKTWIYRVTVNSCLSTIRKQSRHQHESLKGLYGLIESDDSNKEAIERLHSIISTFGTQDRAIIMMWIDEMSYDEISSVMGLNRNTIATRVRRIKEKIINKYKREEYL